MLSVMQSEFNEIDLNLFIFNDKILIIFCHYYKFGK